MVAVVATTPDNAKTYFGYRPARVLVAADPELSTHRAYGVPGVQLTPQLVQDLSGVKIDVDGALSEPLPIPEAAEALARMDGYQPTEADRSRSPPPRAHADSRTITPRAASNLRVVERGSPITFVRQPSTRATSCPPRSCTA